MKLQGLILNSCSLFLFASFNLLGQIPLARSQVIPDSTLGNNSSVVTPTTINGLPASTIGGGASRGSNLFHSFLEFNVLSNSGVYFLNPGGVGNIFARVTGLNSSNINGVLGVLGPANLFLINPNGIIFGPNASLDLRGSFLATTASRVIFADTTAFNSDSSTDPPLLTASLPIGLQFGSHPGSIINQSQANGMGLVVPPNQTLALIGNGITFNQGSIFSASGRVEIGSVAPNSLVDLSLSNLGFNISYGRVQDFRDVDFDQSFITLVGSPNGSLNVFGRQINSNSTAIFAVNSGNQQGQNLTLTATDQIKLDTSSIIFVIASGLGRAGDLLLNSTDLAILGGSQISSATVGAGTAGNILINARNSVLISGSNVSADGRLRSSQVNSSTQASGNGGDIRVRTRNLRIEGQEAGIFADASGQDPLLPGRGGSIGIEATENVQLFNRAVISTSTRTAGAAGSIDITTPELRLRNSEITVNSEATGQAGGTTIRANQVQLDQGSEISAASRLGNGGDLIFFVRDSLELRNRSRITTTAGIPGGFGDGGNIRISSGLTTLLENSDILAQAFRGRGGRIDITTNGLFLSPGSRVSASSQQGVDGVVQTNEPENSPSKGIFSQPVKIEDLTSQINPLCRLQVGKSASRFVNTGRGGVADTLDDPLTPDSIQEDLGRVATQAGSRQKGSSQQATLLGPSASPPARQTPPLTQLPQSPKKSAIPDEIVEAQGWVLNSQNDVVLVANTQSLPPHNPWINPPGCHN